MKLKPHAVSQYPNAMQPGFTSTCIPRAGTLLVAGMMSALKLGADLVGTIFNSTQRGRNSGDGNGDDDKKR